MPQRGGFIGSALLHLAVLLIIIFGMPSLFERRLPEDTPIAVELVEYLRPEARFDGLGALQAQMAADCERARVVLSGG